MSENVNDPINMGDKKNSFIFVLSQFGCECEMNTYLVVGRLFFSVDAQENSFFCVVALHLHHYVILLGLLFGAARPRTCSVLETYGNTL